MAEIDDKMARNARESVEQSVYKSGSASGFNSLPSQGPTQNRERNVSDAERLCRDTPAGVNVHWGRGRKG